MGEHVPKEDASAGGLVDDAQFWEREHGAPILRRNAGFLPRDSPLPDALRARISAWPALCGADSDELRVVQGCCDDEAALRIFERDAERTFVHEDYRQRMMGLLRRVWPENRDYHQGEGYVCSLLMLLFDEETVMRMLLRLTREPRYTPGYWRAAPEPYVRDAMVYARLVNERFPQARGPTAPARNSAHSLRPRVVGAGGRAAPVGVRRARGIRLQVVHRPLRPRATIRGALRLCGGAPTRKPVPCYCAPIRGARRPILGTRTLQAFLTEGFVFLFKFSLALIEKTSDKLLACKVSCAPGRSSCAPYHARTLVPWLPTGHCAQPLGYRRQCHLRDPAPRSRHLPGRPRRREVLH